MTPTEQSANFSVQVCDLSGNVFNSVTQLWRVEDFDAPALLATRPVLVGVLRNPVVSVLDSAQAAELGIELAGLVPNLLASNRPSVAAVLELVEMCASSASRQLHIQRLGVSSD